MGVCEPCIMVTGSLHPFLHPLVGESGFLGTDCLSVCMGLPCRQLVGSPVPQALCRGRRKGKLTAAPTTLISLWQAQCAHGMLVSGRPDAPGGPYSPGKPLWGWRKQPRRGLRVTAVIFFQLPSMLKS